MPTPVEDLHARFQPDYTPEQLENLGVYDALYRGQAPRLASLGAWKPEWISEHDPKGWAQWYKRYVSGRRIEGEDERQIRRWLSFKARHGGPFAKKPTPRRGWALRNWGIDPSKLVAPEQADGVTKLLDEYQQRKQLQYAKQAASPSILDDTPAHILVSGHSGAGKSTLAKALAEKLNLPYAQVDHRPEFKEFLVQHTPDDHLPVGAPKHDEFKALLQDTALKTLQDAKTPTVIEGAQLAYLPKDLLAKFKRVHVNPPRKQIYDQRMERTRRRYEKDPTKQWTPEVEQEKRRVADLVYGFHTPTFQAYDKLPGTLKYQPGQDIDKLVVQMQKQSRTFYHGTAKDRIESILQKGLDPSFAGTGADKGVPTDIPGYEQRVFMSTHSQLNAGYGDGKLEINLPDDFEVKPLFPWPLNLLMTDHYTTKKIPAKYIRALKEKQADLIPDKTARAQLGAVFPVSGPEPVAEAEPGQAMRVAPALSKQAELAPEVQLQEHQQRVSDRIAAGDPRLLLYHGLGTGKSLSAIAAAEAARKVHGGQYGVVVPASLKQNFQKELGKFTSGSNPEILSYTGLALGKKFQQPPETLVMDEAQRLKNPESAAAVAARNLAAQAKRVVLLSGTPITNSPGDLASPLSILRNENITPEDFEKKYVGYEKKFPGIIPYLRGADYGEEPFVKNEPQLREMLAGMVDYQPGKLPEGVRVNEETVRVPLSPEQRRIQKAVRTKIPPGFLWKLDQEFPLSREELAKLNSFMTGMRQVSLSTQPFRADKSPIKAFEQSSKLREALKRLRENLDADPRRKAIIYSNFIDAGINPYAAALEREKIPYGVFHGGIAARARQKALADYNAGKLRALLLGPAAAEGISTKGTSLIQLLDPYWHESRTQQARGRGLRFDSHAGLPDDLKDVSVQRYLSASEEPHFLARLIGKRRERTGDEVMQHLADKKEQLNEKFRAILREVGSEKAAASFGSPVIRQAVGKALPYLTNSGAMAAGGGVAGWAGNDAFLNEYHPEVTGLGRLRSNLRAATMGAAGGLMAKGRVSKPGLTGGTLAGLGLGVRYGIVTPSKGPLALGEYTDPGHAAIPKFLAWHDKPENQQQAKAVLSDPLQHGTSWGFDKLYDKLKKQFVDNQTLPGPDGTEITKRAPGQIEAGKQLREEALPATYSAVLEALGAPVKQKTVRDIATGQDKQVPDVQFADIGTALAPHLAGGAGGAYLGYRLGDTVGNFLFPDSDKDEYESRRRQENRRWWMQFLGGNLGAVGGTVAAIKAMPQLREIMRNVYANQPASAAATAAKQAAQHVTQKTAAGRFNMSALMQAMRPRATAALQGAGQFAKNRAVDLGYGAGITAGQYALNQAVPGYIPSAEFNDKGEQVKAVTDPWFLGGLTALNAAASRPWRKALSGGKPSFTSIWPSGTFLTAGPSLVYPFTHVKKLYDTAKVMNPLEKEHYSDKSLPSLAGAVQDPMPTLKRVGEIAKKKLDASNWQDDTTKALEGIAHEAGVPGFDDKEHSAAKFLGSAGWGTLGQGAGIATGGVAGMVGGDWLADTVLNQAVKRKWLKKRPGVHKFIRDLSSLAGAGLGAYGGLRALNAATPAVMKYYASKTAPAASTQATTPNAAPVSA